MREQLMQLLPWSLPQQIGGVSLDAAFLGNTVLAYALAAIVFAVLLGVFKAFQWFVLRRLERAAERTKTEIDDTLIEIVRSLRPSFYSFLALYLALQTLAIAPVVAATINAVLTIWVVYQVVVGTQIFINYLLTRGLAADQDPMTKSALAVIGRIIKGILWGVGILLVLSNLGINITSLLAGVGIGGIAIAFALQNILADLFSSFAIYFDKPFKIGDFIAIGDSLGTVERIGIKTTRIKALEGEELTISNQELTSARVQNYGRMDSRRVALSFGVIYETPTEKLRAIPEMIEKIIRDEDLAEFDRAHFHSFEEYAIAFEVVYYVQSADYNTHMDVKQRILGGIKERFDAEGVYLAYPTRRIYTEQ